MSVIRVGLADDHALAHRGVRSLFEEAGDIEIVAEAEDGDTAAALALTNQPDVLVTDIEMFGLNGL
jgi:two-component system invasion response regulator UvrY